MSPDINLKPCPFCGGKASSILGYIRYLDRFGDLCEYEEDEYIWFCACVFCHICGCEIEKKKIVEEHHDDEWYAQIKRDAVDAWNRRANDV